MDNHTPMQKGPMPLKIVSLCPSNTELLAYLGRLDDVAAVDDSSDWPPEVKQLPNVGPDLHIDMDRVEALKPDLVVASLSVPGMERNVEELKRRGLPHLVLASNSLEDIANDLLQLGEALGETKKRPTSSAATAHFSANTASGPQRWRSRLASIGNGGRGRFSRRAGQTG